MCISPSKFILFHTVFVETVTQEHTRRLTLRSTGSPREANKVGDASTFIENKK